MARKGDLLCYAFGHDSEWQAICVDLDVAVQGQSQREVFTRLEDAVESYIAAAKQEEPHVRDQLLRRSAPWRVRASLWFRLQSYLFFHASRRENSLASFGVACPA